MKGFFKKSISLVLALMMVLSMFTGMIFTANAETTVTFTSFENIEDNYSTTDFGDFNVVVSGGTHTEDGKWDISESGSVEFGDANFDNYVFEADFYFSQTEGFTKAANNNFIEFQTVANTSQKTQNRLLGSYAADSTTKLLTGTSFSNVSLQSLHTGVGSYSQEYADGGQQGKSFASPDKDTAIHVRIEVLNGYVHFAATYDGTTYKYTVIGNKGASLAGVKGTFKFFLNSYTTGSVCKVDNMKIACLDTVTYSGSIEGAELSTTVLAPGTPDNNTGILYGGEVALDVFGKEMPWAIGSDVTIVANDGYDVSKPGVRTGVTLMAGETNLGTYDITYSTDLLASKFDIPFDNATLPEGWTTGGTIADGKITLDGAQNLVLSTVLEDFIMEYDYTQTLTGATGVNYLVTTYFLKNGSNAVELSPWMDTRNSTGEVWRLMLRNGGTAYTGSAITSANGALESGVKYHIVITCVDGVIGANITNTATGSVVFVGELNVPNIDSAAALSGGISINGKAGIQIEVDNINIVNYHDVQDQSAYAMSLNDGANVSFNAATAAITATGTAAVKYYGFKANGTVNLADMEMYYNGNGTVTADGQVLNCTVVQPTIGSTTEDFDDDTHDTGWTMPTAEGAIVDGKYLLTNANQNTLKYALTYNDYIIEYDITPYLVQYITGSALSLVLPGPGSVKYEMAVFYDNYSSATMKPEAYDETTFPAVGDTTSKKGNYVWRLFDRNGTKQQLTAGGDIAPVGNSRVTSLSPETNEAFAEKFAFEDSTTYRVRVEMIGNTIRTKIVIKDGSEINWADVAYVENLSRDDRVAATGNITFNANMDDIEALIDNISISEYVDTSIAGYEAKNSQAVEVGTSVDEIDTAFVGVLANGVKFDLYPGLITSVTGYDSTKVGVQTVTLNYGDVKIPKRVTVYDVTTAHFEDFDYEGKAGEATSGNAKVTWNTNAGTVADGRMTSTQTWHLLSYYDFTEGVISTDVLFSSANHTGVHAFAVIKFHSGSAGSNLAFGVVFNAAGDASLFLSTQANVLASVAFDDFALDTEYRMEMRIYGNVVKGYVDGVEKLSYVANDSTDANYSYVTSAIALTKKRAGISVGGIGGANIAALIDEASTTVSVPTIDNIYTGSFDTYTITEEVDAITAVSQTVAQPGDKVYVSADINANNVLKANDAVVFQNAASTYGGTGNDFVFTMPAANVTLTAEGEGDVVETVASSKRNDNTAVRFLNRIYLPTAEGGLSVADVQAFGAVVLPADLLGDAELTLETANAYNAVAYNGEKAVLYDITGKYADYVVAVTTSNADRVFACRAYYIDANGAVVYGDTLTRSING